MSSWELSLEQQVESTQQTESRGRWGKEKHNSAWKSAVGNWFVSGRSCPMGPHEGPQLAWLLLPRCPEGKSAVIPLPSHEPTCGS